MLTITADAASEKKKEQQPKSRKPKAPVGVLPAVLKVLVDYLAIQGVNWSSPRLEQKVESHQLLQALHVATWIVASVPFINFCHSCWMVVGELGQWLSPSEAYQSWDYNPSPWGPVGAVIEYGLAGMLHPTPSKRQELNVTGLWGVTWHGYFKFGFQSASVSLPLTLSSSLTFHRISCSHAPPTRSSNHFFGSVECSGASCCLG